MTTLLEKKVDALVKLALCNHEGDRRVILDSLREMMTVEEPKSYSYHDKVVNLLLELGIPNHIRGYRYLIAAFEITHEHPEYLEQITKVLYPEIGKRCDVLTRRVERCIRHAIEVSWDRADYSTLVKYFGNTTDSKRGRPTNAEFLARVHNILTEGGENNANLY